MALAPVPFLNVLMEIKTRLIEKPWIEWLNSLRDAIAASNLTVGSVSLAAQDATVITTPFPAPTLSGGLYRVTYAARVTQAAGVSSSLTVRIDWTNGMAQSVSGAAMTGNTTTTTQSGVVAFTIDAGTPVSYTLVYASVGAPVMQYSFDARLEALP